MPKEEKKHYLALLITGDRKAFRWVYDKYHHLIYRYCLKLVRLKPVAEEATADVFMTIWQKRDNIQPEAPFDPLLYKVAKDIAYNYLKKIATNNRQKEAFLKQSPSDNQKSGEVLFVENEAFQALRQKVDTMPPKRKKIFKLRFYQGMKNPAIADQLDISVHTVRNHLAMARRFLKQDGVG